MSLFRFLRGLSAKEQVTNTSSDETGYVCNFCGRFNPMSFKFCPDCGNERFTRPNIQAVEIPQPKVQDTVPEDETTVYLRKIGLLHLANKQYQIQIQLENGALVKVPLIGRQNSNDVLTYLRDRQILSKDVTYKFPNWPNADPCIGPWYHHVRACVCELDTSKIYRVESLEMHDMRLLYGCPNAKAIIQESVLDRARVELVDYES